MQINVGKWNPLLEINWRIKPYEIVFLAFSALCTFLVLTFSPLPFSWRFASVFILNICELTLAVFALSVPLVAYRYLNLRSQITRRLTHEELLRVIMPYWSLDFLILTLRRGLALLGTIYFFLHLKHVIYFLNPKNYDLFFWNLDRAIHGGIQPNIFLMSSFGDNPDLSVLIDWLYFKYFDYKLLVSFFFLLEIKGRILTDRFFLAYVLLWTLGGMLYLPFPTDGPCYAILHKAEPFNAVPNDLPTYQRKHVFPFPVTEEIPEQYQTTFEQSKIWTAKVLQEQLWLSRQHFLFEKVVPFGFYGIAAMPSLHVAAVVMLAIFLSSANGIIGALAWIYAASIAFGSVFLQWHYAIDGYIGVCLALITVWLSKRLIRV